MMLVSGGYDHTIRFWDVSNGSMIKQLQACTPTCSPHFLWSWASNRSSGPAPGLGPEPVLFCPASPCTQECAAATLGQGPLRACALTSTGGLSVPRLADQRAADFARCAPGHRVSGVFAPIQRVHACARARTLRKRLGNEGEKGTSTRARGGRCERGRYCTALPPASLPRESLESAISPVLTTYREHTDRKWLAVAGNPHVRLYRCCPSDGACPQRERVNSNN